MKVMRRLMWLLLLCACSPVVHADRGSIPFESNVQIFEPNQRALIAWNGETQILLLSTDLYASAPTKVLEVIPFRSEPKVKAGDMKAFERATALVNSRQRAAPRKRAAQTFRGAPAAPAARVTYHEQIGAHDISVVEVLSRDKFVEWVMNYLRKSKVESPAIPEVLRQSVNRYLADGFHWFVFDVVALDEKPKTNQAIQYTFQTDRLFYPLRISQGEAGRTHVNLLVLTPGALRHFDGIPMDEVTLSHAPIAINRREVGSIDSDISKLFRSHRSALLRQWELRGLMSKFNNDILAR